MLAVKVFAEGVAEQIKAYLPPEYESVTCSVKEQNKTNGVLQVGIQADMPGHAASPIVYMESFYDEVRSGEPMDKIMGNIAEVIQDALDGPALDQSIRLEEFESIKDYLSVMVVNTAENRKLLEQVPHKEVADLSLLCYADLPVDQGVITQRLRSRNRCCKSGMWIGRNCFRLHQKIQFPRMSRCYKT